MKKLLVLFALCATASAQTYRAVTADTNNVIRTNFTMPFGQLTFGGSGTNAVPVASGGTGATNSADAIANLLPTYTGNSNAVLALDSNATSLVWSTNVGGGGGIVDLADNTNGVTNTLGVANGGTGGTNYQTALEGLGILTTNTGVAIGLSNTNTISDGITIGDAAAVTSTNESGDIAIGAASQTTNGGVSVGWRAKTGKGVAVGNSSEALASGVAIGRSATAEPAGTIVTNQAATNDRVHGGIAIGPWADGGFNGSGGGIAIGFLTWGDNYGIAHGWRAVGLNSGVAIGYRARMTTNGFQLGTGTNTTANSIQFITAGAVDTNEWAALANVSSIGTNVMRTTNATWLTNSTASNFRTAIGLGFAALTNTNESTFQGAIFPATTTNAPTNTNAPTPDAWLDVTVGTNAYKLPLWQ